MRHSPVIMGGRLPYNNHDDYDIGGVESGHLPQASFLQQCTNTTMAHRTFGNFPPWFLLDVGVSDSGGGSNACFSSYTEKIDRN